MSEANAGKEAYRETGILTKSPDIQPVELIAPGGLFDEDTLSALSSQLSALSSQLSVPQVMACLKVRAAIRLSGNFPCFGKHKSRGHYVGPGKMMQISQV
ncbi:hypothetical protein EHW64_02185 [Erwinia psidii]|uniref:hypothetical protein n=1 Tax=Erwinia psidii TaxID=69224 RepID=UPI00226B4BFB|nr:hypothetical protein [Erwinia psidii]MCX8960020.1 hypothetical protein [Erwinia psidii]